MDEEFRGKVQLPSGECVSYREAETRLIWLSLSMLRDALESDRKRKLVEARYNLEYYAEFACTSALRQRCANALADPRLDPTKGAARAAHNG